MKSKFLMFAICAIAFSTTVSAQKITYGAKVGFNLSNLSVSVPEGATAMDYESLLGLTFGVTADYALDDKSSLSAELLYSPQGAKMSYSGSYSGYSYEETEKIRLNYLNVPIMYNYYVIDNLSVAAGVQFGFVLSAKEIYDWSDSDGDSGKETEKLNMDYYSSTDISIPIGVAYDLTENILVGARYNLGMSNLFKDAGDYKCKNNTLAITVGYKF